MNHGISRGNFKIVPKLIQFIDILHKTLTRLAFLTGRDAVVFHFRSAALGLGIYVQTAALVFGAGLTAAFIIGSEYCGGRY